MEDSHTVPPFQCARAPLLGTASSYARHLSEVGVDGVLRFKLLLVIIKEQGVWWIAEYHNVAVTPEA